MIDVIVYAVCDYVSLPNGGEVMLLNNFLAADASQIINYHLVGMSFNEIDLIGHWQKKRIGEREYDFFPVTQVLADKENTHIPFRFRVTAGIKKYWGRINSIKSDYHYIHSAELAIPLWNKDVNVVYHVHGDPCQTLRISRFPLFRGEFFTNQYWKIIEKTIRKSKKIVWAANRSEELYMQQQPHMRKEVQSKSTTIHSSFDSKLEIDPNSIPTISKRIHLATVGRLSRVKRIDFVIEVVAGLVHDGMDADLLICGDGEERDFLQEKAGICEIADRVLFLGTTDRKQTGTVLNEASAFVFASENEAMSLVVLESLYMGTPVISTNVGDINEVVRNGITGYIIDGYNIEDFKSKIQTVIREGKEHYSDNCRLISEQFTPERMARSIDEVFNALES